MSRKKSYGGKQHTTTLSVCVEPEMADLLDDYQKHLTSERGYTSRSRAIRQLIIEGLKKLESPVQEVSEEAAKCAEPLPEPLPERADPPRQLEFDFALISVHKLNELQVRMGACSHVEVVRRALSLLDYATGEEAQGSRVIIRRPDGDEHVVLVK